MWQSPRLTVTPITLVAFVTQVHAMDKVANHMGKTQETFNSKGQRQNSMDKLIDRMIDKLGVNMFDRMPVALDSATLNKPGGAALGSATRLRPLTRIFAEEFDFAEFPRLEGPNRARPGSDPILDSALLVDAQWIRRRPEPHVFTDGGYNLLEETRKKLAPVMAWWNSDERKAEEVNLLGGPLEPCSAKHEHAITGYRNDGTCSSSERDPLKEFSEENAVFPDFEMGRDLLCVTISKQFYKRAVFGLMPGDQPPPGPAQGIGGPDLPNLVQDIYPEIYPERIGDPGQRWCISAWAWASAVAWDPTVNENLRLHCEASNMDVREIYKFFGWVSGPMGAEYESAGALEMINELCKT